MKWRWLLILLPACLGIVAMLLVAYAGVANPRLVIRAAANLSNWLLAVGIAPSLLLAAGAALWAWRDRVQAARLAQERSQSAEARRQFLQRLDHELKNPLTAIRAGLANLAASTDEETRSAARDSIEAQTIWLSRLTANLRKLSDLETRPLARSQVNLTQLLAEAVELVEEQQEASGRRITLTVPQAPWPLPEIMGDWDLLFLAVYNLLDNAVKFSQADAAVEVRAREEGAQVVIEVADTGPGIESRELPQVWQELYRGQQARSVPGSGLGLALVKAIVERHGGQVSLDSRSGQGTVATMRLPI